MHITTLALLYTSYAFTPPPPASRPLRAPTRRRSSAAPAAPETALRAPASPSTAAPPAADDTVPAVVDPTTKAYDALGITKVLEALAERTATHRGAESFRTLQLAENAAEATRRYDELRWLVKAERDRDETCLALANHSLATAFTASLDGLLDACEKATIPEVADIALAAQMLRELDALYAWVGPRRLDGNEAAALAGMVRGSALKLADADAYAARLDCNPIRFALEETDDGTILSGHAFPELGAARARAKRARAGVESSKKDALEGGLKAAEKEGGFFLHEGRWVVSQRAGAAPPGSLVHGASRTGKTQYVEPAPLVGPTNEWRAAESKVRAEEAAALRECGTVLARHADELRSALQAVGNLDACRARHRFGLSVEGNLPIVDGGDALEIKDARHAVLALRSVEGGPRPKGNNVKLGADAARCFVISGANAGGKTVWLKTLGLCTALVRLGTPIPCRGEPRIGVFDPVFADVGDAQSAEGNVSTYVGHLRVAAAAVNEARSHSEVTPLVLLDELGSGTDAAQGAALGRAVLEDLVEHGALVVCTTHARPLKGLGLGDDPRFRAAAMAPGFKVVEGRAGESDALEAARTKADFPSELIERAEVLLSDDERRLATLARDLDKARESAEAAEEKALASVKSARDAEARAEARFLAVEAEAKKKAALQAQEYESRVASLEKELQQEARRSSSTAFGSALVQEAKAEAVREANTAAVEAKGLEPLANDALLEAGDVVAVLKRGPFFARRAKVEALLNKGVVLVNVDGVAKEMGGALKLKRKDLARAPADMAQLKAPMRSPGRKVPKQLVGLDGVDSTPAATKKGKGETSPEMRTAQNTLDLRGQRYDDAERETDYFLDRMTRTGGACFVLHGHGTGALKKGLRQFLKGDARVKSAKRASEDDGGDAFTRVELRR